MNKMLEILLEIGTNGDQMEGLYWELEELIKNFYFCIYEIK